MNKIKNKAASELSKLRWAKTTPEERMAVSKMLLKAQRAKRKLKPKTIKEKKISQTYKAIHTSIIRKFGKACFCQNINCPKKSNRYEWALIRGAKYDRNPANYLWLCKDCHTAYDFRNLEIIIGSDLRRPVDN